MLRLPFTSENDVQTRDVVLNHIANEDYTFILADFSGMLEAEEEWGIQSGQRRLCQCT